MTKDDVLRLQSWVNRLDKSTERAEEAEWCVESLQAHEADDLLPALKKAAELLALWHAAEEEHDDYLSDLADGASY